VVADLHTLVQAIGYFATDAAAASTIMNILRDAEGVAKNITKALRD